MLSFYSFTQLAILASFRTARFLNKDSLTTTVTESLSELNDSLNSLNSLDFDDYLKREPELSLLCIQVNTPIL